MDNIVSIIALAVSVLATIGNILYNVRKARAEQVVAQTEQTQAETDRNALVLNGYDRLNEDLRAEIDRQLKVAAMQVISQATWDKEREELNRRIERLEGENRQLRLRVSALEAALEQARSVQVTEQAGTR